VPDLANSMPDLPNSAPSIACCAQSQRPAVHQCARCDAGSVTGLEPAIPFWQDAARMYEWFDRVGFAVDCAALRREFPDVAFHDFESWAKTQDWSVLHD
jgi:hypothetical protein